MANGIIIVDKPMDWTSQDVTAKLRGVFHQRRIGHGGTLDPMATGVLPVFIGRATRGVEFFEHADKEYVAGLRLGTMTDTQDTTGTVLETRPVNVTRRQLEETLTGFLGEQEQLPPMYSAVKIGGKRLYELARAGKTIERKPRSIHIFALELLDRQGDDWGLRIHCSKGTYVRTLCADIGKALGCGGCMSALRRTKAGAFGLQQSYTMEQILSAKQPEQLLLPVDTLFAAYPCRSVTAQEELRLRNGADWNAGGIPAGKYRVYNQDGVFLALCECRENRLRSIKSFFEVE